MDVALSAVLIALCLWLAARLRSVIRGAARAAAARLKRAARPHREARHAALPGGIPPHTAPPRRAPPRRAAPRRR